MSDLLEYNLNDCDFKGCSARVSTNGLEIAQQIEGKVDFLCASVGTEGILK